uniref:Uncharacterized protein n=1 Tax=Ciona savignyi TaxID=51511 RepID=H2YMP4_CIOSA
PGPRGIPLLGFLPFLGNYPERTMYKWSKKYGPVMSVRMGRQDWVILGDHETIRQGLVNQGNSFSGRPLIATIDQITEGHGILLIDYGDWWKRQRRFGFSTLRGPSASCACNYEVTITTVVERFVQKYKFLAFKRFILSNAVSNNISSIVLGRRFEYDDERFKEIMARLAMGTIQHFNAICRFNDPDTSFFLQILIFLPACVHLPYFSRVNKKLMEDLLREIVAEHKSSYDQNNHRDFIDAFLGEQKAQNGTDAFTDKQLLHYVRDLFFAGSETTATTLRWALLSLIHHPKKQEKLRKEIFKFLGKEKIPAVDNKSYMPYTCAFMQEVYRYRTIAPLGVAHMTNEDVNLNGYSIPNGTTIFVNLWAVHNNPDVWDEPNKFKPERHLDDKGNFVQSNHVIPFSVGPRHCLGEKLARMEVFIYLVSLVQKFEFL